MYYFVTSSKDASIYLQQPTQNTGLDEVLEVSKVYYGSLKDTARSLIKFDIGGLSSSVDNGSVTMSSAELILKECESSEIPLDYTIEVYPVSESWDMGLGTRFDDITTDGVTWNYRASGSNWLIGSASAESTGSFDGKGGMWFTGSEGSQSFSYESSDLNVDVLSAVNSFISGTLPHNGFIIKHTKAFEDDTNDYGQLKFFSKETHTIHQPKIRVGWDDSEFNTGSLSAVTLTEDIKINTKRLKKSYKVGTTPKIEVHGRELYPARTFSNTFAYNDVNYLPTSSYYQISDLNSNDIIIPFGDYSKISCNASGNYFKLNLTNFEINRDYKVEFKIERSGTVEYFDDDITFEVVK
tara:strand:+ start:11361 stop:12419 length:1059 start_codon:yes stop_codon:yes gene_type:complete